MIESLTWDLMDIQAVVASAKSVGLRFLLQ